MEHCKKTRIEFLTEFIQMKSKLDRLLLPVTQEYGLTPMSAMLLNVIEAVENVTVSEIFKRFELNQGNVSSMCKRLEASGYIIRQRRQDDERSVSLEITDAGKHVLDCIEARLCRCTPLYNNPNISLKDIEAAVSGFWPISKLIAKLDSGDAASSEENNHA